MSNQEGENQELEAAISKAKQELEEKFTEEKKQIVAELLAERKRRQEAEEELKNKAQPKSDSDDDPEKVVEKVLSRRMEQQRESNKAIALDEFRRKYPELSEQNDPAGIVFKKFQDELKKFNMNNYETKEEFVSAFNDVYEFMNRKKPEIKDRPNFYNGTPSQPGHEPQDDDKAGLSDAEKRLLQDLGWTKDRYLAQKKSKPAFVASLLKARQ